MGTVYKIDGIGTRGNPASDNPFELVNKERRLRFVSIPGLCAPPPPDVNVYVTAEASAFPAAS